MNKIKYFIIPENDGVSVYALSEDGAKLAGHFSSTEDFAKHDIGYTSDWKHDIYKSKYPDGYELMWCGYEVPKEFKVKSK